MKKLLLILTMMAFSATLFANIQTFAPENDLWKEDSLLKSSNVTQEMFNKIIDAGYKIYTPYAKKRRERLTINRKWSDSTVNANCSRIFRRVTINMFGGLARRPEISAEGFALVLCHELGHAYGGTPYIRKYQKLSAEGQADYFGAGDCLKKIVKIMNLRSDFEPTAFIQDSCTTNMTCIRSLVGGQSTADLLATLMGASRPDYQTPDETVVSKTLVNYPKTVQCRLDTYLNGVLDRDRPACWFKN